MPIAALLPAIIGAGGAISSSLINHGGSSGSSSGTLLPAGLDQKGLLDLVSQQKDLGGFLQGEGRTTLGQGRQTLTQPLDFFSSLLSGDRTALNEKLAPEIAAINAQFAQPLKEATLTGRGGALASDLNASKQAAISNLMFQERPQAADKLASIAQGLMSLGTQQVGGGASILGQAGGQVLDYNSIIRGIQAQTRNDSANMFGQLGMALGPILQTILGGRGGSGSSGGLGTAGVIVN